MTKMITRPLSLVAAFLILAALCPRARADLSASLTQSIRNSAAGQTLVFCGALANTSATDNLFLNNVQFTLTGTASGAMISGSTTFYANVPGLLLPGETYTGPIFSVALTGSAPSADYAGAVTLQGGADIFASSNLATQSFTVLSPALTLVVTGAAAEDGPASATFTISRTGSASIPLPVSFTIGGTAVNGSDYQAILPSSAIASGSSFATLALTPIPNDIAQPNPTASLTLTSSTLYNLGAPLTATVAIQVKPADTWRYQHFGALANSAQAADTADWTGAGIPNLLAFALGINPLNPTPAPLPSSTLLSNYLTLTYQPNPAATDLSYTVQASTDLINWSASNVQLATPPNTAPPGSVTYRYVNPIGVAGRVFLRLQVTRTDP